VLRNALRNSISIVLVLLALLASVSAPRAEAQQPAANPHSTQPQVKVNVLNVCTPSADEQKEIASALARAPKQPLFSADFEVSRGRSTLSDMASFLKPGESVAESDQSSVASYVRIRHEFSVQALFSSVQYSFSDDGHTMVETLVLHVRDPKDLMSLSLEDSASAVSSVEAMLTSNTPVSRVRLERFGKSSVALARCSAPENGPAPDQSAYEPLFRSASEVLANYRTLLGVPKIVPAELAKIAPAAKAQTAPASKSKPPAEEKK
jgi:hypothetical protein